LFFRAPLQCHELRRAIESAENLPSSEDGFVQGSASQLLQLARHYGKVCLEDPCATLLVDK
jgi:hypothetical protein